MVNSPWSEMPVEIEYKDNSGYEPRVIDESRLLFCTSKDRSTKWMNKLVESFGLEIESNYMERLLKINNTERFFWVKKQADEFKDIIIEDNEFKKDIKWIGGVYKLKNEDIPHPLNLSSIDPESILIEKEEKLKERGYDISEIMELCFKYNFNLNEEGSRNLTNYNYFETDDFWNEKNTYVLRQEAIKKGIDQKAIRYINIPLVSPLGQTSSNLGTGQWNYKFVKADTVSAQNMSDSSQVIVAVIDDGVDLYHADLRVHGKSADIRRGRTRIGGGPVRRSIGHGTNCAGIISAIQNNQYIDGLSQAQILSLAMTEGSDDVVATAIKYATDVKAKVISMSIGTYTWDPEIIGPEINNAYNQNIVMCACTQNQNFDKIAYPASDKNVIAVGACDAQGNRAVFNTYEGSNYGPELSVVAPGVKIKTLKLNGNTIDFSGTSAATPHVSALAALIIGARIAGGKPQLTPDKIKESIEQTASNYLNWNQYIGYGYIDFDKALSYAMKL